MSIVLHDSRWCGKHGIGRFAQAAKAAIGQRFSVREIRKSKPSSRVDWIRTAIAFRVSKADLFVTVGFNGSPLLGGRQIMFVHDLIHLDGREPLGFFKRLYYDQVVRRAARQAFRVVTVSDTSAEELRRYWPEVSDRIAIIPGAVATEFTPPRLATTRSGLVLFANNRWHKNLGAVLMAISEAQVAEPIKVVGKLDEESWRKIDALGLRPMVRELGRIGDEELAETYRRSKALIFCSLIEGFGLPILEALACGCGVIASDIPAHREVAGDAVTFASPVDVSDMARKITVGLQRPPSEQPSQRGPVRSWNDVGKDISDLVVQAIERPSPTMPLVGHQ